MEIRKSPFVLVFAFLALSSITFAEQINSSTYRQRIIVSTGGENITSSSYKNYVASGIINRVINSSTYINKLGFFYGILLANGQPCTSAGQCEGGFCCSSSCRSSSCPTSGGQSGGGGGDGGAGSGGGGGGGISYVCNNEWKCIPWGECINGLMSRNCEFAKVPQHVSEKECDKIESPPKSSENCAADITVDKKLIKEHLKLGTSKVQELTIKNTGSASLNFDMDVLTINEFIFLSDTSFSLKPGEERKIEVNINGRKLGSYLGEIEMKAGNIKKVVSVVIEVESEQVLFDVKIDIPSAYREVRPGGELRTQITLLNVGPPRKVDVMITYIIKDKRAAVIYESSETFAVEAQKSYSKSFKVPETLKEDDYLVAIEVRYENSFAVSSELFHVTGEGVDVKDLLAENKVFAAIIMSIGILLTFLYITFSKLRVNMKK